MKKKLLLGFFIIGAASMLAMSFHYLVNTSTGIMRGKEVAEFTWYLVTFRLHVSFGLIAMITGPFQFLKGIRKSRPNIHRYLGYTYASSIFASSIAGLIIAQFAMGGLITTVGFSTLAILWFLTTYKGIQSILQKDLNSHRRWMYFSYALTFATIPQRTLLLIPLLLEVPFIPIYQLSAWLPWILNLCLAHLIYVKSIQKPKFIAL